jgi:hypothetical protein
MMTRRQTPLNDDHGDQFPGALPARALAGPSRASGADERMVRMRAAYVAKVNAAVQADRQDLAHELATSTFAAEFGTRPTARRSSGRTPGGRPPGQASAPLTRMRRLTRRSLERFDRYTLDVFNPGAPYRPHADR